MFKRITAIAAIGAVLAVSMGATTAGAADPKLKSYGAGAYATALELTLLGQNIAVSTTSAAANSNPQAKADGAALLLAGSPVPGAAPSAAPEGPATNHVCAADIDLDALTAHAIDLLGLQLSCVDTTAAITDGFPDARSASGELVIRVTAPGGDVLGALLQPALEGVQSITDPLLEALKPLTDALDDATQIDVPAILNDVLDAAQADELRFVIAEIAVAPSAVGCLRHRRRRRAGPCGCQRRHHQGPPGLRLVAGRPRPRHPGRHRPARHHLGGQGQGPGRA